MFIKKIKWYFEKRQIETRMKAYEKIIASRQSAMFDGPGAFDNDNAEQSTFD